MIRTRIACTGTIKPARTHKCAGEECGNHFQPRSMTHKVCDPEGNAVFAVAERQRLDANRTCEAKAKFKTRTEHLADAQAVFNRYIQARDEALPCISIPSTTLVLGILTTTDPLAPSPRCASMKTTRTSIACPATCISAAILASTT